MDFRGKKIDLPKCDKKVVVHVSTNLDEEFTD